MNKNKKITVAVISLVIIGLIVSGFFYYKERQVLISDFTTEATRLDEQKNLRDENVKNAKELLSQDTSSFDQELVEKLEFAISDTEILYFNIPKMSLLNSKLFEQFGDLKRTDNSPSIQNLAIVLKELEDSIAKADG